MGFGGRSGWAGGGVAGQISGQIISPSQIGVGLAGSPTARVNVLATATTDAPTVFNTNHVVIGREAASGASSGALSIHYNTSSNTSIIASSSPGINLRDIKICASNFAIVSASATNTFQVDTASGKFSQTSGDSSASPGDATINAAPVGKSAIAAAATAATITNNCCGVNSRVFISPIDIDATLVQWKVVPAAGSFTVTGNAAATATWKFFWHVIN